LDAHDAVRNAVQQGANLRQFILGGRECVGIRRILIGGIADTSELHAASQFSTHTKSGYCALRAPTMFSVRMKSASVPKTWLWIKATPVWGFSKIVDCVRMRFSSARNRRSARTGRRPRKLGRNSQ
jgi:hypothetical protein